MPIDPTTLGLVIAILALFYTILFGQEPIAKVIRAWREERHKPRDSAATYLPKVQGDIKVLNPVPKLIAKGAYSRILTEPAAISDDLGEFVSKSDPFQIAASLVKWGETLVVEEQQQGGVLLLREAIGLMKQTKPDIEERTRLREHILGRAYNTIGYFYRGVGDYGHAAQAYLDALPFLRCSGNANAYAHTLKNLGYILHTGINCAFLKV